MIDLYMYREIYRSSYAEEPADLVRRFIPDLLHLADQHNRGCGATGFAEELLLCLRSLPPFRAVDRICLAQQGPGSHLLQALGSANDRTLGLNPVHEGYHCFVSPQTSLTALSEGRIRVYRDSHAVLARFAEQGLPPQRTLRLISEMGLRSGISLPLRLADSQGFLFLNSCQPGLFDLMEGEALEVLGLAVQVARNHLRPVITPPGKDRWLAGPFVWETFVMRLAEQMAVRFGPAVRLLPADRQTLPTQPTLWLPDLALRAVVDGMQALMGGLALDHRFVLSCAAATGQAITLHLTDERGRMSLRREDLRLLAVSLEPWGAWIRPGDPSGLDLTLPCDVQFHTVAEGSYSV